MSLEPARWTESRRVGSRKSTPARDRGARSMSVVIPDEILRATGMSEAGLLREVAVLLFQQDRLTLAQASRLAGMPRLRFQQLLASRQIPIHYDKSELEEDIQTLRSLGQL